MTRGALIWRGNLDMQRDSGDAHAQRKDVCGHSEKVATCKPRREVSGETNLDHGLPGSRMVRREISVRSPSLRYFVMDALGNKYKTVSLTF